MLYATCCQTDAKEQVMTTATEQSFPVFAPTDEQLQGPALTRPAPAALQHPLSDAQLSQFWEQGYVSLPGLFSADEAKQMSDAADALYHADAVNTLNIRYDFATSRDKPILWKIDPFFDLHAVFRRTVFDRRILDALASIYRGREPRLFKDKLIYKPPHSHGNALHQDYNWWQGYPTSLISVTVSIDPGTQANGCTVVYPRDPRRGFVGQPGSFDNQKALMADPSHTPDNAVKNIASPGDVLLFHCFTPHEAGANTTDQFRRQLFLSYNDAADGEHYFSHAMHYRQYYLRGKKDPQNYYFE